MDKYIINESLASPIILWVLCALSVYFSCVTDYYFLCVAGIVIFFVSALWKSVVLIKCRQKLVVDAEGIHYAERKRRKLVWRHYYWKDVKCCYFDYEIRHSLYPFAFRQLYILRTDGMKWNMCNYIELVDFELAFMLRHLQRAVVTFSGVEDIIDEEKTSAKRKVYIWLHVFAFLFMILILIVCKIMAD